MRRIASPGAVRAAVGLAVAMAVAGAIALRGRGTSSPPEHTDSAGNETPPAERAHAAPSRDRRRAQIAPDPAPGNPEPPAGGAAVAGGSARVPVLEAADAVARLREAISVLRVPAPGTSASGDWRKRVREIGDEVRTDATTREAFLALVETETEPAACRALAALAQFGPLGPLDPAERDRAWRACLAAGTPERRIAAGWAWFLGEQWTESPDSLDRMARAIEGDVPLEALQPFLRMAAIQAVAGAPRIRDALHRAIDRAPAGADVRAVRELLENPWSAHDPDQDLIADWRAAGDDATKRADAGRAFADRVASRLVGGVEHRPPPRSRPLASPAVRGLVEVYGATADRAVRALLVVGAVAGLGVYEDARPALLAELAALEPDAELRRLIEQAATDPGSAYEDLQRLAR